MPSAALCVKVYSAVTARAAAEAACLPAASGTASSVAAVAVACLPVLAVLLSACSCKTEGRKLLSRLSHLCASCSCNQVPFQIQTIVQDRSKPDPYQSGQSNFLQTYNMILYILRQSILCFASSDTGNAVYPAQFFQAKAMSTALCICSGNCFAILCSDLSTHWWGFSMLSLLSRMLSLWDSRWYMMR